MTLNYNPPSDPLDIIYEDAEIVVVNKPSGLLSVPGKGEDLSDCLIERLKVIFPDVLLVHRLDRDTSGLMIFGLTKYSQRHLNLQFEKRQIKKSYLAEVWGKVVDRQGIVNLPLRVDWPNRPLQHVDYENGKEAITNWRVLRYKEFSTRLRLVPETGRSHQLRVHMKELGHPILGDPFYANGEASNFSRLMLHAESLRFMHPNGGRGIKFQSPCPF